ncbi:methyl-accepting chemotaxis protein II, partial [Achromobacter arsenitoxydans SY8]
DDYRNIRKMFSNLKVRTGLMLAQLAVAVAALIAIVLGWNSMQSNAQEINALDTLSVQQNNLIKDAYTQMLRATIRADIAAAQRAAGDTNGANENSRTVQQLVADAKKNMETFKAIPKTTAFGKSAEGELVSSFNSFTDAVQSMMAALDKGDAAAYLSLKNTKAGAASGQFFKQLGAFAGNINKYSEEMVASARSQAAVMTYVYIALAVLILAVSLGAFLFMNR